MRLITLPIVVLSLVLNSAGHPTPPDSDAPAKCKAPAIADCLHLLDLISSPSLKGLPFPIYPGGFSPVAYYGDCALAAVYTDGVVDESLAQVWGEAAEVVRDMVDIGLKGGEELPIARDVGSGGQRGTFTLVLTVAAGDIGTWKDTVDGCMVDLMMGRGRIKPNQDQLPVFSLRVEDQYTGFRSEQQQIYHRLPTCGLVGVSPIDGLQYGCNAQAIPSPLPSHQGDTPSAKPLQGSPFTQLIGRCPHGAHWKCLFTVGRVTCFCTAPHVANITEFKILTQLLPNNNETVVSLFDLKCTKDELVSCFRVIIRPFRCGCAPYRSLALESEPQMVEGRSDILFDSVQWPICKEGAHLKCCPRQGSTVCFCGKGIGCPKKGEGTP